VRVRNSRFDDLFQRMFMFSMSHRYRESSTLNKAVYRDGKFLGSSCDRSELYTFCLQQHAIHCIPSITARSRCSIMPLRRNTFRLFIFILGNIYFKTQNLQDAPAPGVRSLLACTSPSSPNIYRMSHIVTLDFDFSFVQPYFSAGKSP